ncbi:MAG: hypothetical protein HOV80_28520 [Polyangiaceae bacterium]|nr:hypothetical protein [Polyangiaceae bacterium]
MFQLANNRSCIIACLLLGACHPAPREPASSAPDLVTVDTTPVAPSPTASAVGDARPASNAKPAGTQNIVAGASMAGIALWASEEELTRVLGKPEEISPGGSEDAHYLSYQSKGLSFLLKRGQVITVFAYSGRVGGYEKGEFRRFDGKTAEGVGMDARYDDVIRTYGEPSKSGELDLAPVPSRWIDYAAKGIGFDFITATGELITINVSIPDGEQ